MELIRQKNKFSQAQLATLVGSKQPAIARMESGLDSEVSLDFLAKVAIALDVSFTFKHAA
jgi:transcriptional regulator with XRE-family HTH domain